MRLIFWKLNLRLWRGWKWNYVSSVVTSCILVEMSARIFLLLRRQLSEWSRFFLFYHAVLCALWPEWDFFWTHRSEGTRFHFIFAVQTNRTLNLTLDAWKKMDHGSASLMSCCRFGCLWGCRSFQKICNGGVREKTNKMQQLDVYF